MPAGGLWWPWDGDARAALRVRVLPVRDGQGGRRLRHGAAPHGAGAGGAAAAGGGGGGKHACTFARPVHAHARAPCLDLRPRHMFCARVARSPRLGFT
eukprot:358813-Chlamydomonas_euryale.AAC.1